MSPVTTEHPGGMCDSPGDIPHWLERLLGLALHCNWSLSGSVTSIMTSSPSRGEEERERKTVCAHPSMSISNYSSTNHRRGSIGSGWAGWGWGVWRCDRGMKRGREGLRVPTGKITDQYRRMDFVILKRAVRGSFTPTCSELYPPTQTADDTSVHHVAPAQSFFTSASLATITLLHRHTA